VVGGDDVASRVGNDVAGRRAGRGAGTIGVAGSGAGTVGIAGRCASLTLPNSKSKGKCIVTNVEKGIVIMESRMKKTKLP
jgi:hypothetical protein